MVRPIVVLKGSDGQDVTIKAGAAAANVGAGREAPAYAPIYPGATVLSRAETANTGGEVTSLRFSTKDPVDKVVAFYRAAVGRAGVPVSADMVMAESAMFAAEEEAGGRGMQLTASGSKSGVTIVQLTYHAPKK